MRRSQRHAIEKLESRELFSGWWICLSAGYGIAGGTWCVGAQGVSQSYGAGVPIYVAANTSLSWNGGRFVGYEYGISGGAPVVGSLSNGYSYNSNGQVTRTIGIGAGLGAEAGHLGFAATVNYFSDIPIRRW